VAKFHERCHLGIASVVTVLLVGCSSASGSPPTAIVATTPTPDAVTQSYVALVSNFWLQYRAAEVDAAKTCFGGPNQELKFVDPPACRVRVVAMLPVMQKFLGDLDATPPPPRFAADDQAFRSQFPKAIADLKALVSAAKTANKGAVLQATATYVDVMIPVVTQALDDVDPSVVHN
jgi:hypothetical protein